MFQKYLDPIIDHYTTGAYYAEVYRAKREYFEKAGLVHEDNPEYELRMNSFVDWYLYDRDLPGVDLPPIKHFFRKNRERMSPEEQTIHRDFCASNHSLFRLKRFSWDRKSILVEDLFSQKVFTVSDPIISSGFARGDVFEARLIPFRGSYEFSRAFCFHPPEMEAFILAEIKKVRFQDKSRQSKLILLLSAMKLKHLRYQHIAVEEAYRFDSKL